ncbi:MAG: hypothetical protein ACLGIR_13565 [Actinomycetes bacterium]
MYPQHEFTNVLAEHTARVARAEARRQAAPIARTPRRTRFRLRGAPSGRPAGVGWLRSRPA